MSMPRNVLFMTAGQWRGDRPSALGHRCLKTAIPDHPARQGVLFRRRYAQSTPRAPSRASL